MPEKWIKSRWKVSYDNECQKAVDHLEYNLDFSEVETFFNDARYNGKAFFEDRYGNNFILKWEGGDNYRIEKRSSWIWV